ncbi:MAG: T9SS type A sorting domain-containing protein [Bacteroidia bacterium]|nr:T9SS type A sorting domain-containing protein [Bacteroidia bacterium]MDW8333163.1 T9SS type A sorting domain-containing protein [Bacteroidia bacterium]
MKKFYIVQAFLVAWIMPKASAQLLYNNGATITITNAAGPGVYVQGGVQNNAGGVIDLSQNLYVQTGSTPGDFANAAGATLNINGTGVLYVQRHFTNSNATAGSVNAAVGSKVVFNGGNGGSQNYSDANPAGNPLYNVELQTDDVNLLSNMRIQTLGTVDFSVGPEDNIINTGNFYLAMSTSGTNMSQFTGIHATGGDATIGNRYVNGNVLWQASGAPLVYRFPVGAKTGTKAAVTGAQYMELEGRFAPDGVTYLEAYFEAAQPMTTPTGCKDRPLTHYTGIYHWRGLTNATLPANTAAATPITTPVSGYALRMRPYSTEAAALDNTDIGAAVRHPAGPLNFSTDVIRYDDDVPPNGIDNFDPCQNFLNKHNVYVPGLTSFSKGSAFGTTDPNVPFPIETLEFNATPLVSTILLDWRTMREINTAYFDLERSLDGRAFTPLKTGIPAKGFTASETRYSFEDDKVQFNTLYYYRLRVVDNDGRTYYSQIREAMLTDALKTEVRFYPNPTNGDLTLDVVIPKAEKVQVRLYDARGRLVIDNTHDLPAGRSAIDFGESVKSLAAGSYMARVVAGGKTFSQKLVKN